MKKYKQKEVAKIEGVEPRSVSRWTDEELSERGYTKYGSGHGTYYTRDQDGEIDDKRQNDFTRADLEIKKLKADIALKEQKIDRDRRMLFREWSDRYTEAFTEAFSPLKDILAESRFEQENTDKWNGAIDKCIEDLKKLSENIYQSVDTQGL